MGMGEGYEGVRGTGGGKAKGGGKEMPYRSQLRYNLKIFPSSSLVYRWIGYEIKSRYWNLGIYYALVFFPFPACLPWKFPLILEFFQLSFQILFSVSFHFSFFSPLVF